MKILIAISLLTLFCSCSTILETYIEKNNFTNLTTYDELIDFVNQSANASELITKEYFAVSAEGRKIPLLKISNDNFGNDKKLKVMIFAQQHGNEQSGKEGALLLLKDIANGNLNFIFDRLDLLLIPQVNPDGSEKNKRRNSNDMDLNRNHLILTENETEGLHKVFHEYLPEATMDVHEYYPYSKSWIEFGYLKNYDEQLGTLTNPNVPRCIIEIQKKRMLDYYKKYLSSKSISSNEYLLGGPPGKYRMRYSTIDVNDGRQGFGILNTFSVIQEGKNGKDSLDNIEHRAIGQYEGMIGYLLFLYENADEIKSLINNERNKLLDPGHNEEVVVRMEHVKGDSPVEIELRSISSGKDTVFTINDFNYEIETHVKVEKPKGYLIPKPDKKLVAFLEKHHINYSDYRQSVSEKVIEYKILEINKKIEEEDEHFDPVVEEEELNLESYGDYHYVPVNQITSNLLVIALEPESMLGIMQYKEYHYLLDSKNYPILKVVEAE